MTRLSRFLSVPLLLSVFLVAPPVAAQSAQSVVDEMRARHDAQLDAVDNYVVETTLYTSYHRKVTQDGQATYETTTRMTGESEMLRTMGSTPTTTSAGPAYLDRLAEHASYIGTETVNGTRSHVLRVTDPGAVFDGASNETETMDYYVDADAYVPLRMVMTMAPQNEGNGPTSMTITFSDYRTVDGLTLPYVMEMTMDLGMSEEQRRQLQQMQEKLEQMPERQREQMKRMMGQRFEQMQNMVAGEPTTIEVQSVRVNEGLPEGIFSDEEEGRR